MNIFLSASIPLPNRDRHFFATADILAIREAIKALVEIVIPNGHITYGGHPTITPLIDFFVREAGLNRNHLTIYQSRYFEKVLPVENDKFHDVRMINAIGNNRQESLIAMRTAMIESQAFDAAIFIGGMEGVIDEAKLFEKIWPRGKMLPIASTGAAAADIYKQSNYPSELNSELTYHTLFKKFLLPNSRTTS